MKEMKRILSLVLCLVMLVGMLPVNAFATDAGDTESTGFTDPTEPEASSEPTESSEPEVSSEPTESSEPEVSSEPTESSEPEVSSEPTESSEATEPEETQPPKKKKPGVSFDSVSKDAMVSEIETKEYAVAAIDNGYIGAAIFAGNVNENQADLTGSGISALKGILEGIKATPVNYDTVTFVGNTFADVAGTEAGMTSTLRTALEQEPEVSYAWSVLDAASDISSESGLLYSGDYYIYHISENAVCENAGAFADGALAAVEAFELEVAAMDQKKPLFVVTHAPLHASNGESTYARFWYEAVFEAAKSMDVIVLWGSNGTGETTADLNANYVARNGGETINVEYGAEGVVPNFVYMNAGTVNANGQTPARLDVVTTALIYEDRIVFQDYNSSGAYTGSHANNVTVEREHETVPVVLTAIEITGSTEYFFGDSLDLTVQATYSDGSTQTVEAELSGYHGEAPGSYEITAAYGDLTATTTIDVWSREFVDETTGIAVTLASDAAVYDLRGETALPEYGVTGLNVAESTNAHLEAVADGRIQGSLYEAYDISLSYEAGYEPTQATKIVTLPIPYGVTNPVVYYVSDDGQTVTNMNAVAGDGVVTFETTHFSTYLVGQIGNIELNGDDYQTNSESTTENNQTVYVLTDTIAAGDEVLIVSAGAAGAGYALSGSVEAVNPVTIESATVNGTAQTFIRSPENGRVWTVGGSNNAFTFTSGDFKAYMGRNTEYWIFIPYNVYEFATSSPNAEEESDTWEYSGYRLTSTLDDRGVCYADGTWLQTDGDENTYLYKKVTGATITTVNPGDRITAKAPNISTATAMGGVEVPLTSTLWHQDKYGENNFGTESQITDLTGWTVTYQTVTDKGTPAVIKEINGDRAIMSGTAGTAIVKAIYNNAGQNITVSVEFYITAKAPEYGVVIQLTENSTTSDAADTMTVMEGTVLDLSKTVPSYKNGAGERIPVAGAAVNWEILTGGNKSTKIEKGVVTVGAFDDGEEVTVKASWTDPNGVEKSDTLKLTIKGHTWDLELYQPGYIKAEGVTSSNFGSGEYYTKGDYVQVASDAIFNPMGTYYTKSGEGADAVYTKTTDTEFKDGVTYYTKNDADVYYKATSFDSAETYYTYGDVLIEKTIVVKDVDALITAGENTLDLKEIVTRDGEVVSGAKATFTSSDTTIATVDENGVVTYKGEAGTVTITAKYEYADGKFVSDVVVFSISKENYYVKEDGTNDFPGYPQEGAIRTDKTATAVGNFSQTGLAQVELSMTGVPYNKDNEIDVVIMVDMSGSMKNASGRVAAAQQAVLKAMDAIVKNEDESFNKNRIGVYYFAGDSDAGTVFGLRTITEDNYTSSRNLITNRFKNTNANGGTNYTAALSKCYEELAAAKQDATGKNRQQFCIFISDGAPSTGLTVLNANGTTTAYGNSQLGDGDNDDDMEDFINMDEYYSRMMKNSEVEVYSIGIQMDPEDNKNCIRVLANIAGNINGDGSEAGYEKYAQLIEADESPDELITILENIMNEIKQAATDVEVVDIVDPHYSVNFTMPNGVTAEEAGMDEFYIQVVSYELDETTHERKPNPTVLERFEFNTEDTTKGTITHTVNDVVCAQGTCTEHVVTSGDTITNLNGTYFKYEIKDGKEVLTWTADKVDKTELALQYFVHLNNSTGVNPEDQMPADTYYTNEKATVTYTNYQGNRCQITFPRPSMTWKGAKVTYVFYLVNENGIPVNSAGQEVPFAEAEYVTAPVTKPVTWNEDAGSENMLAEDLLALEKLPDVYRLYDSEAYYEIRVYQTEGVDTAENAVNYNYFYINGAEGKQIDSELDDDEKVDNSTTKVFNTRSGAKYDKYGVYSETKTYKVVENGVEVEKEFKPKNLTPTITDDIDYANTTVAFAVVWTGALVEDTVVVDYGLDTVIDVTTNDGIGSQVVGVRADAPQNVDINTGRYTAAKDWQTDVEVDGVKIATAHRENDTSVRFKLDKENGTLFKAPAEFYYESEVMFENNNMLQITNMYSKVTVVPATTVYYEDSFLTLKSYTLAGKDENNQKIWNEDTTSAWVVDGTAANVDQAQDRPDDMNILDANNIYGYDDAYAECANHSLGSSPYITVDADTYGTAEFSFWGTGFDLVSLTSGDTGSITVLVKKGNKVIRNTLVDTYYGVEKVNEDGSLELTDRGALYQVPVIKVAGLDYDKYTVKITAGYSSYLDHKKDGSYTLYMDAIRIYDPTGNQDAVANEVYLQDNEAWPVYQELRNNVIAAADFNVEGTQREINGVAFIDTNENVKSVVDYVSYGPNNELYLAANQAVAFSLNLDNVADKINKVHIGLKSADGEPAYYAIIDAGSLYQDMLTAGTNAKNKVMLIGALEKVLKDTYQVTDDDIAAEKENAVKDMADATTLEKLDAQATALNQLVITKYEAANGNADTEKIQTLIEDALSKISEADLQKQIDEAAGGAAVDTMNAALKGDTIVNTSTDMYYDITALKDTPIIIYNQGDGILSLTNIKLTFTSDPGEIGDLFYVDYDIINGMLSANNKQTVSSGRPATATAPAVTAELDALVKAGSEFVITGTVKNADTVQVQIGDNDPVSVSVEGKETWQISIDAPTTAKNEKVKISAVKGEAKAEVNTTLVVYSAEVTTNADVDLATMASSIPVNRTPVITVKTSTNVAMVDVMGNPITSYYTVTETDAQTQKQTQYRVWTAEIEHSISVGKPLTVPVYVYSADGHKVLAGKPEMTIANAENSTTPVDATRDIIRTISTGLRDLLGN